VVLAAPDGSHILIIPSHGDVKRGTLRALIRQAGMTVEQFRNLIRTIAPHFPPTNPVTSLYNFATPSRT
jgi:hypothetical protein